MSEHWSVSGNVKYWHLPYGELGGSTWCNLCKKTCKSVKINYDEGICGFSLELVCPTCKKVIWHSYQNYDNKDAFIEVKDDKKCSQCGKPTNEYDANNYGSEWKNGKKVKSFILCSKKCNNLYEKRNNIPRGRYS